jgi:isopenicillin-N N-acyltransferase-like protein
MFGAWGEATKDGKTIQLRSLDWDIDGPFWKYPLIAVYHPKDASQG